MRIIKMVAVNLLVVLMIIAPFLPGPPSKLVIGLSVLAQLAGFFGLVLVPVGIIWAVVRVKAKKQFRMMPYYLVIIPLVALCARVFLAGPLSDFSRNYSIKNSEALISRIEAYRSTTGQYPESLQQLQSHFSEKIPGPAVMGILGFRYNKIDDHYSISFSQWLDFGSLEEIVLYDKDNLRNNLKGIYAEYDYSFDLCRIKGAFANYSAGVDHWRYYLAD